VKHKLIKVAIIAGALLALVVPSLLLLHSWMGGSATGTVHVGTPTAHQEELAPHITTPVQLDTPYFTTSLPGDFRVKRQTTLTNGGPILFQLNANTDGKTDEQFGATIGTTPTDGLVELADYKLRSTDTSTYAAYTPDSLPPGAIAFHTVSGPAALTVFWPEGSHYAELSFSTDGVASESTLQNLLSAVIAAWDWK